MRNHNTRFQKGKKMLKLITVGSVQNVLERVLLYVLLYLLWFIEFVDTKHRALLISVNIRKLLIVWFTKFTSLSSVPRGRHWNYCFHLPQCLPSMLIQNATSFTLIDTTSILQATSNFRVSQYWHQLFAI